MKLSIRILLCAMAALMILALPFAVPSGSMLEEYQDTWADEAWDSGLILPPMPRKRRRRLPTHCRLTFLPACSRILMPIPRTAIRMTR